MRTLEIMREELLPLEAAHDAQAARRRALMGTLRFVSPLLLLHDVSTTAAGTDAGRVDAFRRQCARFFETWDEFYVTRIYSREPIEDLAQTPSFTFEEPSMPLSRLGRSGLGLLVPMVVLLLAAWRGFRPI